MSYIQLARSSFNDEEIHQMLAQNPPFVESRLRKTFRNDRGLILSSKLDYTELPLSYSRLGYSWKQFEYLASHLDGETHSEKKSSIKLPCEISTETFLEALQNLKEIRNDEDYLSNVRPNSIDLKATYIKTDFSKSKSLQREKKSVAIDLVTSPTETEIFYDSDERAAIIVSQLIKELRKVSKKVVPAECEIAFYGIEKENTQTKFFLSLIGKVEGFKRITVSDVKVNRATPQDEDPEETDDAEENAKEEMRGLIKTAFLRGEDVTSSKLFQQLIREKYFISGISWFAREIGGDEIKVELEAGFKDDKIRSRFFADAKRTFAKTEDNEDEKTGKRVAPSQRISLQRKIITSAYKLFDSLSPKTNEE